MAGSGIGISILAGLPDIIFGGSGAPLPENFFQYPPRIAHAIIAKLLMLFVVLHIAGVIYHQFRLKDKLVSRMWFGKQ
jgi:cytochrome b561